MNSNNLLLIIGAIIGANLIANIAITLLNKDFRNGNYTNQLTQLKGLWLVFYLLPFFIFNKIIKSLVKDEKQQIRDNKLKERIRKKNLNNKNRRK